MWRKRRVAELLLEGHSHRQIASKIGVSREWVSKLAKTEDVQDIVTRFVQTHESRLDSLVGLALDTMEEALASDQTPIGVRVRAAESVLDRSGLTKGKLREKPVRGPLSQEERAAILTRMRHVLKELAPAES